MFNFSVCPSKGSAPRSHTRCSYECMSSAVDKVDLFDELSHKSCVEEILFWTVKYEFPEKITTWLLSLLPDETFKVKLQLLLDRSLL